MSGWDLLVPEYLVVAGALIALFGEVLPGRGRGASLLGAALALAASVSALLIGAADGLVAGALVFDQTAVFIRAAVAGLTAVYLFWLAFGDMGGERRQEAVSLALLSAAGGMFMAAADDIVTLFIAVELSTMPAYVLMGYRRRDIKGLEGALKYFLLSLLTSLVMLYGFSFLYGLTGATRYAGIAPAVAQPLGLLGALLVLVGLFAKMSAVPFHFWAPDAYEGASASAVAFVSTVPKVAGTAVIVRLADVFIPGAPDFVWVLLAVGALSMILGNLVAFPQTDLRRLMAYSGVAHTGYLLLGPAAGGESGSIAALVYAVAYAIPSMAVMLMVAEEGTDIGDIAGLGARRPWLAWTNVVFLVSLVGIPPLAGFFGKLYLFGAALGAGEVWSVPIVLIAVLVSVASAGYYFRIVHSMFFAARAEDRGPVAVRPLAAVAHVVLLVAVVGLGVGFSPVLSVLGIATP